jgi:rhodanese-related sulfurtransferase
MRQLRQAVWEGLVIALCAIALGFTYTYVQHKGFFDNGTSHTVVPPSVVAPSMIHVEGAKRLFDSGGALFIDARHSFDYNLGHIKGAISLPLNEFDQHATLLDSLPKTKVLITYCDGIECNSSIELAAKMYEAGISDVRIFFDGWEEWERQHYPVESTPRP